VNTPYTKRINVLVIMLFLCLPSYAKRKDIIVMKNGDRLSGEVKKLENGVLYVSTDYFSGSVGMDWLQVEEIQSTGGFHVILKNGKRAEGTIEKISADKSPGKDFQVQTKHAVMRASALDVVSIEPRKSSFWDQLNGAIDIGYDFTSGNSQTSVTSDANATYLGTKWMGGFSFTSSFSGQPGAPKTNLLEVQTLDGIFLNHNSFLMGLGDFLHSSQQDLKLRTTLGGGYGRFWLRTNHHWLVWLAGAAYTHELFDSTTSQPAEQNLEALLGVQYQLFRFDRYSLQSQLLVYPGLTDAGRIRTTTKSTFTIKLSNNFHTDFSFWDNFDSRPPFNAKGNEMGITNSVGWSF